MSALRYVASAPTSPRRWGSSPGKEPSLPSPLALGAPTQVLAREAPASFFAGALQTGCLLWEHKVTFSPKTNLRLATLLFQEGAAFNLKSKVI